MIDLEQFVGKKVVVTLENGTTREGVIEKDIHQGHPYSLFYGVNNGRRDTYTRDGYFWAGKTPCDLNIKSIKLKEKPMIDLEQFVGKEVFVTLEDGTTEEGLIKRNDESKFPYLFQSKRDLFTYTRDGYYWKLNQQSPHNIESITLKSDNLDNFLDWAEKATLEELDSYLTDQKNNNKVAAFLKKNLLAIFFPIIIGYGFFLPKHSIIHYYAGILSMLSLSTAVELVNVKKDE
jgi:small nuclear ribonucleoprotein (snRNP)-like protein